MFEIIGAILLWRYGLPERLSRAGHIYFNAEQVDEAEIAKAKHYDRRSKRGLGLLVLGFVFQLLSNFLLGGLMELARWFIVGLLVLGLWIISRQL